MSKRVKYEDKPDERSRDNESQSRLMADDPMYEYFKQKEKEKHGTKPVYTRPYPPNRYNIKPGYRWDGVDRSNGYEKKAMEKLDKT